MSTPGLNYSNAEALHEGVASHRVLEKAQFDYRTVGILGDSIPQTHPRIREGWDIENKYSLAKSEAVDSFNWFMNAWNENGWEISDEDYDIFKKMWMLAGSPFMSNTDPITDQKASHMHYYSTSKVIDINTREVSDNDKFYIGAPDIIVIPDPNDTENPYNAMGPFALLDELGHAIQFAYPKGFPGKNLPATDDLGTFVASDEFLKLLKDKKIASDQFGNEVLVGSEGYQREGMLKFDSDLQDSTLFIMAQQMKGDPYLDRGVVNMFDNPEFYDQNGNFMLRYALKSYASDEWLTGEAEAHQVLSPALHLALADLKTSTGDRELSVADIESLQDTRFGRMLTERMIYGYGIGQEAVNYGSLQGIQTHAYNTGVPNLVQYNKQIKTDDDRYKIARLNEDLYLKQYKEAMVNTVANLKSFREGNRLGNYRVEHLERILKENKPKGE